MPGIPSDVIEEIRSRCNIAEVIGSFVQLRRAGGNSFKGLCPFHNEKTPSFVVDTNRQSYHCFGCGKGGDIFRFFMDKDNMTFVDAVRMLASRTGVAIPESDDVGKDERDRRSRERERIYRINEELCSWFVKNLQSDPNSPVAQYLKKRNLTPEIIAKFKIGAAPSGWSGGVDYCRRLGFKDEELIAAGVAFRSQKDPNKIFDLFHDRLTFTIENELSRPIGFSARSLEAKPADGRKYVNSPETMIFKKSRTLYALSLARQAIGKLNMAILCEGQMDTIAFHRAGFECAVAPLGSAFTSEQAQILNRYTNRIVLAFDADSAGEKAFLNATGILLPLGMDLKVMRIPGGKDPDELYNHGGAEAVGAAVKGSVSWLEVLVDTLRKKYDFSSPAAKGEAAAVVVSYLEKVPSQVALEAYISQCAGLMQVREDAIFSELARARRRAQGKTLFTPTPAEKEPATAKQEAKHYPIALLTLLELAINHTDAGRLISELTDENEFSGDDPVNTAMNIAINGSLAGEHEEAVNQIRNLLTENPTPEISRILVENNLCKNYEKAVTDAVNELHRIRKNETIRELTSQLLNAQDDAERRKIMTMIKELK